MSGGPTKATLAQHAAEQTSRAEAAEAKLADLETRLELSQNGAFETQRYLEVVREERDWLRTLVDRLTARPPMIGGGGGSAGVGFGGQGGAGAPR